MLSTWEVWNKLLFFSLPSLSHLQTWFNLSNTLTLPALILYPKPYDLEPQLFPTSHYQWPVDQYLPCPTTATFPVSQSHTPSFPLTPDSFLVLEGQRQQPLMGYLSGHFVSRPSIADLCVLLWNTPVLVRWLKKKTISKVLYFFKNSGLFQWY